MITQKKFIDVVSKLTEDDFKEAQDLIEQLGKLFEDEDIAYALQSKIRLKLVRV